MRTPGFSAETSLYRTRHNYRLTVAHGPRSGALHPSSFVVDIHDLSHHGTAVFVDPRSCCRDCLASIPCADESCRRQRLFECTNRCNAAGIGGCDCPPDRVGCHGMCCRSGEVCTVDGCGPPNQLCHGRLCAPGERCTSAGCCGVGNVVCQDRCCQPGWSCTSEGCCPPGYCCETAACPPGKSCCGGTVCCPAGAECRIVNGTSQYGCFT